MNLPKFQYIFMDHMYTSLRMISCMNVTHGLKLFRYSKNCTVRLWNRKCWYSIYSTIFASKSYDSCSGMASFVYGKSTTNQVHMKCMLLDVLFMHNIVIFKRIEAWWSQLQKKFTYWWYSLFKVINILISQN